MDYVVDDKLYSFSYKDLKKKYKEIVSLSNSDFLDRLPEVLHFACFVSYLKELPNIQTISDVGVMHELIHLMDIPEETDIDRVRILFNSLMELN